MTEINTLKLRPTTRPQKIAFATPLAGNEITKTTVSRSPLTDRSVRATRRPMPLTLHSAASVPTGAARVIPLPYYFQALKTRRPAPLAVGLCTSRIRNSKIHSPSSARRKLDRDTYAVTHGGGLIEKEKYTHTRCSRANAVRTQSDHRSGRSI